MQDISNDVPRVSEIQDNGMYEQVDPIADPIVNLWPPLTESWGKILMAPLWELYPQIAIVYYS